MAIHQGTYYAQGFVVKNQNDVALDITGWLLKAELRQQVSDASPLVTLTSAGGGFAIIDAANGRFEMRITADLTEDLPAGGVVFDILRTDADPGPVWLCAGKTKVKQPVTR